MNPFSVLAVVTSALALFFLGYGVGHSRGCEAGRNTYNREEVWTLPGDSKGLMGHTVRINRGPQSESMEILRYGRVVEYVTRARP